MGKKGKWSNYLKLEKGLSIGTRNDQASGIYYVRLLVDGKYKEYSLGKTNRTEAIIEAGKRKGNVQILGVEGIEKKKSSGKRKIWIHSKWDEFLEYKRSDVISGHIKASRMTVYNAIDKNWFGKYIKNKKRRMEFDKVNDQFVLDFWKWRLEYIGSEEHKRDCKYQRDNKLRGLVIKQPTGHGLDNERKILKEFLAWAFRMDYTVKGIPMQLDKKPMSVTVSAEGFSYAEYEKVQAELLTWIQDAPTKTIEQTRRRIEFKFRVMLACGTRTADLIQLQWKDVRSDTVPVLGDEGKKETKSYFIAKAKKKRRIVPITKLMASYFTHWRESSKFQDPDDFVFATETGKSSSTDNDNWKKFLKENDCLFDPNGKSRTMTSLRHTFASFAILYTDEKTSIIADRMGTSEREIENTYKDALTRRDHDRYTSQVVPMLEEDDMERWWEENNDWTE